jgi:hypothetical protein
MNNLFETATVNLILQRIDLLTSQSERQWGKMTVSQMLEHCCIATEVAIGRQNPSRLFIGRIIGWMAKPAFVNPKPFSKNLPTHETFVVKNEPDFKTVQERLKQLVVEFSEAGPEKCTQHPHAFFGKLTPDEWGVGMYKHLDHHLRQFGV